eukprot:7538290-Ditylum_brightwellii.AAC.1
MEEDNTAIILSPSTSIIPDIIPELDGKVEQSLATPIITNEKMAESIPLIVILVEKMKPE